MNNKKNIVYILSDQHNPLIMGAAGDKYVRTPNIDSLYARGTGFDNCYCASPLCVPSRSTILSGRLPSKTGVYNNMQALSSCEATFPVALTDSGYETVLAGRMHFVGWDQWHGYEKHLVGDITPCFVGGDNEREIYGDFMRSSGQNMTSIKKSGAGRSAVLDYDEDVTSAACEFLENRTDDRPLFLTVGFYGPHCPYIAPKELYDYYYNLLPELDFFDKEDKAKMHPAIQKWYENRKLEVTPDDVRRIRASYYAMVELMDGYVGRILETVDKTLGLDNTLIIYTSDHGDNIGEHGLFWKTNFYEGAGRVPAVVMEDGGKGKGRRIKENVSLLDIAPTVLSYAEAEALPEYDGIDLGPALRGEEQLDAERPVVSLCSDIKGDNPSMMVKWKNYKFIRHAGYKDVQLFDLEKDPNEVNDLGCDPNFEGLRTHLMDISNQYWNEEKSLYELGVAKRHFALMKKWFNIVQPELVGEWRGDPANNYLVD